MYIRSSINIIYYLAECCGECVCVAGRGSSVRLDLRAADRRRHQPAPNRPMNQESHRFRLFHVPRRGSRLVPASDTG